VRCTTQSAAPQWFSGELIDSYVVPNPEQNNPDPETDILLLADDVTVDTTDAGHSYSSFICLGAHS
jgi:hypothetical protein